MLKVGRFLLIVCLIALPMRLVFPQEKMILTLEDSIQLALSQNPSHLASEERVYAAKSQIREALSGFFPTLNAQGMSTLKEKVFELEFPSMIPGEPPQRVEFDFTRDYQIALSLSVPLFTGGRLKSGYRQARYNYRSTQEAVRQSRQMTVYNTRKAFFGYLLAKEFVKVAEEAVDVANKFYQNVKSQYDVGMASKFDLLRSEVRVANLRPQLIKAKNNIKIAELGLKTLLGLDLTTMVEIKGELAFEPLEPDLEAAIETALVTRPEVKQLDYQKKMAGEMMKISRAGYFPTVAIAGTYNLWADKINLRSDTWQNFYALNLVVDVPILNGFSTSARVAQSRAMIKEIEHTQKGLGDLVRFEVRQAVLRLEEAKESLLSQGKNVEQAQESLRIAELNYDEGLVTILDVSSTQAALNQARINYSQALYDYVVSRAELDKAMGVSWGDENE
jgi:outer membrane protein TolC